MITEEKINEIVNKIATLYAPDKVILFGSYAVGTADENSDLDFIVIKNTDLPKHKRGVELRRLLYGSLVPMDLKVYTPFEFEKELKNKYSFLNSAVKNSKLVYERSN
jgi:predicted nucleotidyltransferase